MRITLSVCLAAAIVLGGTFFAGRLGHLRAVHAQDTGCNAATFTGAYGYTMSGFVYDARGNAYDLANAGRLVADGNGGFTGADTFSFDGTIIKRKLTGTYTINADCTGSIVVQFDTGAVTGTNHGDIVAVSNAREINFIQTDPDFIFSGVLKRQN